MRNSSRWIHRKYSISSIRTHGSLSPRTNARSRSRLPLQVNSSFVLLITRLRQGLSLSSYGTNCAAFSGIPQEVITRADMYTQLQSRGEDLVGIICGESDEREMKELKIAEEVAKKFVTWEIDVTSTGRLRDELALVLS